jgi:hypothetical protein
MSTSAERRSEGQRDTPDSGTAQAANLNDQAVTAERCAAQLLDGDPAGSAEQLAGRLRRCLLPADRVQGQHGHYQYQKESCQRPCQS